MNENPAPQQPYNNNMGNKPSNNRGYIFLGVLLIAIGALWLFHNFGIIKPRVFDILFSWQMLMVVIGGYLLAVKQYAPGAIVGGLGLVFLLVDAFDIPISFTKVVLPAIVIAIGISMLISRLGKKP